MAFLLFVITLSAIMLTPSRIAKNTVLQFSTVSEMLDKMVEGGLIDKTKETQGRQRVKIKLTRKGDTILRQSIKRESIHRQCFR